MRVQYSVTLVVSLLFCTLVLLEFPELLNPSDDTSNDYSLTILRSRAGGVAKGRTDLPVTAQTGEKRIKNKSPRLPGRFEVRSHQSPRGGDILRLLCIERT
jgi:hypothetical protein